MSLLLIRIVVVWSVLATGQLSPAGAEPLHLYDATPRDIQVRFENSPRDLPSQVDQSYGPPVPARVESAGVDLLRVVIEGPVVEEHLFGKNGAEPGSFGDFVWLFDAQTGHVLDARVEGRLHQKLDWGLVRSTTQANVGVRMSTRERAGFQPLRRVLGNSVFRHCDPGQAVGVRCHPVEAVPFDPVRGYVNAVGVIQVDTPLGIGAATFSPLGEALFLELEEAFEIDPQDRPPVVVDVQESDSRAYVE